MANTTEKIQYVFEGVTSGLKSAVAEVDKLLDKTQQKFASSSKSISSSMSKLAAAIPVAALGKAFAAATKESIAFVENLNLFTVAMGDSIKESTKFIDKMSELYGMDPSNLYRYAGNFYQLSDAIGAPAEASEILSLSLTKAANDIASLFNVDIETVVSNLSSGMQGMTRAVRKYGMDIRAVTLQQTAYNLGITTQVSKMSEADRQALRYLTMMEQVKNATKQVTTATDGASTVIGDFARNIETPANQLRIFKEQISQLGRAIGTFFIPIMQRTIYVINGFIMAIRTALQYIATLMGIDFKSFGGDVSKAEATASAIGDIGDAASNSAKKIKKLLAPFDELNILQEESGSNKGNGAGAVGGGTLDPALLEALKNTSLQLDEISMKARDVRDRVLEFLGFEYVMEINAETGELEKKLKWIPENFQNNLINKFPEWEKTIRSFFTNFKGIVEGFKKVWNSLVGVFDKVKQKLSSFIGQFVNDNSMSKWISSIPDSLNKLSDWIDEHSDTLANLALLIGGIWLAFQGASVIVPVISGFLTLASTLMSIASVITSITASVAGFVAAANPVTLIVLGIAAAIGAAYAISEPFRNSINGLFSTLGAVLQDTVNTIVSAYDAYIKPTLDGIWGLVQKVIDIFNALWSGCIGPVFDNIVAGFKSAWVETIDPILEEVIGIVMGVIDIFVSLGNIALNLVMFLVEHFGPPIASVINTIWNAIVVVFNNIGRVVEGLLEMLHGIIDFIAGVFSGDWDRAWKGIVDVFLGFGNACIGVFEACMNAVIGLVNSAISFIWNGIKALINGITGAIESIADFLGADINLQIGAEPPAIPYVSIPRIPTFLATGGVITRPTDAVLGEGTYDEAVIPLGNSPQMRELLQDFADVVQKNNNAPGPSESAPVQVHVYFGGKEIDAEIYQASKRGEKLVGAQPIRKEG